MDLVRTALSSLMFAFASLCAAAALVAHGGRWHPRLDVLSHFAPIWLLGGLLVLAASPISPPGHNRTINLMAGAVAVLAALGLVAPEYLRPMSARAPADAPRQLKLVQFNNKAERTRTKEAADWIVAEKADVVVLEEASPFLVQALRDRGYHAACGRCSVAILSRAIPVATDVPQVDIRTGARAPTARATFAPSDGGYSVVGVHYVWPTYGDMQQRQGRRLARVLAELPSERLILAGDFNSTPWSHARRAEDKLFGLERRTKALFSWPTGEGMPPWWRITPFLPIDHVYAGKDWKTVSVKRGPKLGSDHFPVVVVLALAPSA